ncbi:MAG: ABC transporter ATP-binding protein [Phycisphaerales bacterium]
MDSFWSFARRMLRYRSLVVAGFVCAFLSAGGLGVGIVAVKPVLDIVLGDGSQNAKGLPEIARELNTDSLIAGWIPEGFIDALPHGPFTAIVIILAGLGVLAVLGALANFLHQYYALTVVHRTVANVRREAFSTVIHLPLKEVVAQGSGDAISRIVNDTSQLAQGLNALLSKTVAQVTKGLAAFLAAFVLNWPLTLGALIVAPLLYTVIRKLGKRIRRAARRALESQAGLYHAATEALQGLRVVKVHTAERYEQGRFHKINKEFLRQQLRVRTARAIASPLVEVLAIFAVGTLTLAAVWLILEGRLEKSEFLLSISALGVAGASLKPVTGLVNDIQQSAAASDRLQRLLAAEPEPGHGAQLPKLPRHAESIAFEDVAFTYPGGATRALDGVSLTIEHGQSIAFVGPNGSGKTTLLSLVPRLFDPERGRVLIDGEDIANYAVRSVRRQIGVVTQETILFRGTIRDNIAYGSSNVTEERIRDAAARAGADEFIEKLPDGYDTICGDQGLTLSGGQRQRLAIARAILRDPAILIMDEATSMIDSESEGRISAAVAGFARGRTCLIVAHRLSTVMGADSIVVMDAGRVVDQGSHDELLDRCEIYRQLAKRQLVPANV